jgi:predicted RecB family nuclease
MFSRSIYTDRAMRILQHNLGAARQTQVSDAVKDVIVGYNADDCFSAQSLRDWLERERA